MSLKGAKILLVDDDDTLRRVISFNLVDKGAFVRVAKNGIQALRLLSQDDFDVMVTDLMMPGMRGELLLKEALKIDSNLAVIIITAFGSIESAVEAMKLGAYDYLTKPFSKTELEIRIKRILELKDLKKENCELKRLINKSGFSTPIAISNSMKRVFEQAKSVAITDTTVLLTGESGTGKEVLARYIHNHSSRSSWPFVIINCSAIPATLIESELFGYEKGAFTGAESKKLGLFKKASGGTLFLDEIGDLPLELQPKLLRAIQFGEITPLGGEKTEKIDVRIIAATNKDLLREVRKGAFREDLYFRLSVIPLYLPPLRNRKEDIMPLFMEFLKRYSDNAEYEVTKEVKDVLMKYSWPGNIRELENTAQWICTFKKEGRIDVKDLPETLIKDIDISINDDYRVNHWFDYKRLGLNGIIKEVILQALKDHDGNVSKTARALKIERHRLLYRMKLLGIYTEREGDGKK